MSTEGFLGKTVTTSLVRRCHSRRKRKRENPTILSVFVPFSDGGEFPYTSKSLFSSIVCGGSPSRPPTDSPSPTLPSLVVLGFGVCEDVRLEVGGLRKLLVAAVERADVGPVAGVDPHVRAQVEVQREAFSTAFEGTLEAEEERGEESVTAQDWRY